MPFYSVCFHGGVEQDIHPLDASQVGVGAALHATPPAVVERGGLPLAIGGAHPAAPFPLATRAHMAQLCVYDVNSVNWRVVREVLRALPENDHTVDWSDGAQFP